MNGPGDSSQDETNVQLVRTRLLRQLNGGTFARRLCGRRDRESGAGNLVGREPSQLKCTPQKYEGNQQEVTMPHFLTFGYVGLGLCAMFLINFPSLHVSRDADASLSTTVVQHLSCLV